MREKEREKDRGRVSCHFIYSLGNESHLQRENGGKQQRKGAEERERQSLIDITVESPVSSPLGQAVLFFFFFAFRVAYSWRHS